tara:strand:+ start:3251 stop:4147 length:897 start_codon:yes stop_codon:yes gene_type:complete
MKIILQKIFLTSILLFTYGSFSAKTDDYISYYRNVEEAYQKGVFESNNDSTIYYMNAAFSYVAEPFSEDLFVLSQAYLSLENNTMYFKFLLKSIEVGIDSSVINKFNAYSALTESQEVKCIKAYNEYNLSVDTVLYLLLDSICREDQRVRREVNNYNTFEKGNKYVEIQDSLNRIWLLSIMKTKGWPGRKLIGTDAKSFTLITHLKPYWVTKHFELLKSEIAKGNLNPSALAGSIDRILYQYDKKPIAYNSFLPGNISFEDNTECRKNRWTIGALSNKVFIARYYKIRTWKPKLKLSR